MNVFRCELRQYKKSILIWAISYSVLIFLFMSATPMFLDESAGMRDMLESVPDAFKQAMNINPDNLFTAVGFFSYIYIYLSLAAAIQSLNIGMGIISKENRMKTADFLMSKPKSRTAIYGQKLLAALCALLIPGAAFFVSSILAVMWQSDNSFAVKPLLLILLTFFLLQWMFLALGLMLATLIRKIKSTLTLTMGVAFGLFMLGMISGVAKSGLLRVLSPLRYFDCNDIITRNTLEPGYTALTAVLTLLFAALSFLSYTRRDIKAVT